MPRRREVPKREILPDPKFNNVDVAKFVNVLMTRGKKSVAFLIIQSSDLSPDISVAIVILLIGPALLVSWPLRMCLRWERRRSWAAWSSLLLLPASVVVLFALIRTQVAV